MENQRNELSKPSEISECRATPTTPELSPLDAKCSVCNSGLLDKIHAWRVSMPLRELSEKIKNELNLDFSKDVLARHFQHYIKALNAESTKRLLAKFDREAENVSEHQKKVLFLCKISFDHIVERLDAGTLHLGIDEFEKMMKLYYGTLRDPDSAGDENVIAIFQRASEKYGCGLEQGVLIKRKKTTE